MKTIPVNLKDRSYNIIIGNNSIKFLGQAIRKLNIGNDAYIISNSAVKKLHGKALIKTLSDSGFNLKFKLIADTEKSKSFNTVAGLIQDLAEYGLQKRLFIIAFGGGVVGDLSGFIAAIYKRGIPYVQIGTTLLAQVDSSIGGKTGIDLRQGKNLAGAFYQPALVYSDVAMLKTLNLRQIKAGMAEVIKYGIIKDPVLFDYIETKSAAAVPCDKFDFKFIVARCSQIKAEITEFDEKETRNIRTILNFGHTIGHAIEAAGSYTAYNHGEAIALGMLIESDISVSMGLLKHQDMDRIARLIKNIGLPTAIRKVSVKDILAAHYSDKKFSGKKNKFVLIKSLNRTEIVESIPIEKIEASLNKWRG